VKAEHLELSKLKKAELYDFMKETRDKEEYRRASAIKQKLQGLSYSTNRYTSLTNTQVIDLWYFLKQMSIEYGMTPIEILHEYLRKNQMNKDRQENGY
jgi:hypothetical protein